MAPWGRSSTRPSPSRRVHHSRRVPACGDARRILRGADPPAARAGPGPHGTTARARRHGARPERRGATARTGCGRRPPGTRRRRPGSTRRGSAARGGPDGPVGVTGLEPATSCSQSRRAANCATPRLRRTPRPHPCRCAPCPVAVLPVRRARGRAPGARTAEGYRTTPPGPGRRRGPRAVPARAGAHLGAGPRALGAPRSPSRPATPLAREARASPPTRSSSTSCPSSTSCDAARAGAPRIG